jgi:subfamily B ATP-binding cassette protein MsbA
MITHKLGSFKKMLVFIKPYWGQTALSILYTTLGTIFTLFSIMMAIPFLNILFDQQPMITEPMPWAGNMEVIKHNANYFLSKIISSQGPEMALISISLLIVGFVFLKTFFIYLGNYVLAPVRNGIVRDVRNILYDKILKLQLSFFSEERKGDIISRMTGDVQEIEINIIRSIKNALKAPITIIIYLGYLIFMSPQLTLFILVLLPISGLIIGRIGKSLRKKSLTGQQQLGNILSFIEETLFGLRIIKAFNAEKNTYDKFHTENESYTHLMNRIWRRRDLAGPLSEFLATASIVLVMWYGGKQVLSEASSLSPAMFINFLILFSQIIPPSKEISTVYYNIQKGLASLERVNNIIQTPVTVVEKPSAKAIDDFQREVTYKHVGFSYNSDPVLKDINLNIEKGKTIALVGQSGAGKSTLVDLLPRFYDVAEGSISIDGTDVRDLKIIDLRHLMGIVSQESILFNDTIYNNIAYGKPEATEEEVISAAKVANAHDFILQTEKGYQTNIGDRGTKLSGGQRQRVSIARAVLKNPPILILDEATSSLDTESEKLVQEAITKLMESRTSIVIAHRLSTIRNADEICVMEQGRIVERGKHSELTELGGVYKKLHDMQMFA